MTDQNTPLLSTDLPFAEPLGQGKVRDLYRLGDDLLLVATDRISAFDVVMAEGIPGKGRVLTGVSAHWFGMLADVVPNHLLSTDVDAWSDVPPEHRGTLRGRTMRCRPCRPLPVEWVVRGYLTGSGWSDYQETGEVSGVRLPSGLRHASQLPEPVLTPSTKAPDGSHDMPIPFHQVVDLVGQGVAERAREVALELYRRGNAYAQERGIVLADTKFEFGLAADGDGPEALVLIDECLTPDSSRYWPADEVAPGGKPTSLDKQVLRDFLAASDWNKQPPPPPLPVDVLQKTAATYRDIAARLTGPTPRVPSA